MKFRVTAAAVVLVATVLAACPPAEAFHHPTAGGWLQRDPAGYVDGMGLYEYVGSGPTGKTDPHGLYPGLGVPIVPGPGGVGVLGPTGYTRPVPRSTRPVPTSSTLDGPMDAFSWYLGGGGFPAQLSDGLIDDLENLELFQTDVMWRIERDMFRHLPKQPNVAERALSCSEVPSITLFRKQVP